MASSASDNDGIRQPTSPATPIASRLVAKSVNFAAEPSRATTSAALASSRCSQLSRTISIRRSATKRVSVSIVERPGWSGNPSERATAIGTTSESVIGARSAYHAPSPNSLARLARDLDRQPGLTHPAGTGQGHQPVVRQQLPHPGQFGTTAHETGELYRKVLGRNDFRNAKRRATHSQGRDGTVASPARGGAGHEASGCPGPPATRRRAADRSPTPLPRRTARSGPRAPRSRSRAEGYGISGISRCAS